MKRGRDGFTLVELIVVVAILLVLGMSALAMAARVRDDARQVRCIGNLRQWGVALSLHMADHDGALPRRGQGVQPVAQIDRPEDWFNCLPPYLGLPSYSEQVKTGTVAKPRDASVFVCPAAVREKDNPHPHFLSYAMNMYLSPWIRPQPHRLAELENPSQLAFMADAPGGWASTVPSRMGYSVQPRHSGKANVVFVDGHVRSFDGGYLGCGSGEISRPDIRWQTLSAGINQTPVP